MSAFFIALFGLTPSSRWSKTSSAAWINNGKFSKDQFIRSISYMFFAVMIYSFRVLPYLITQVSTRCFRIFCTCMTRQSRLRIKPSSSLNCLRLLQRMTTIHTRKKSWSSRPRFMFGLWKKSSVAMFHSSSIMTPKK